MNTVALQRMTHADLGTVYVSTEDGVIPWFVSRGWVAEDEPSEPIFVPQHSAEAVDGVLPEWVTLYHPELRTTHEFPNNTDALIGATEGGWIDPKTTDPVPPESEHDAEASTAPADSTKETE